MDNASLVWPGGEHEFALRMNELRRLQTACDAGPEEVFNRLRVGTWRLNDLVETIRLGLIGAGMKEADAKVLVLPLFEQYPLAEFKFIAHKILHHSLLGPEDDQPGKGAGEAHPPENGASQKSTEPEG